MLVLVQALVDASVGKSASTAGGIVDGIHPIHLLPLRLGALELPVGFDVQARPFAAQPVPFATLNATGQSRVTLSPR